MKRPLFEAGEGVILQSKNHPEYNGEYHIEAVLSPGTTVVCRITGEFLIYDDLGFGLHPGQTN